MGDNKERKEKEETIFKCFQKSCGRCQDFSAFTIVIDAELLICN